CHQYHRSPYTF
nr:immunoglobulin light chain junction region [Mus musculus]